MLVVAGDADQAISFGASQRTAEHYGADFMAIEGAPHNLMLEANAQDIARQVEEWLRQQGVA
jgi:pimeloyl-ACP methyl ester carboxylesterase